MDRRKITMKPLLLIVCATLFALAPVTADAQAWKVVRDETHPIDDSPWLAFEIKAENHVSDRLTRSTPKLRVSCSEHRSRVELLAAVSLEADENARHNLRYRVGEQAHKTEAWSFRRDLEGVVAANPTELILSLRGQERLLFELTPVGEERAFVQFRIPDFTVPYQRLEAACGWVPKPPALDRASYRNNRPKLNDGTVVEGVHVVVKVSAAGKLLDLDVLNASERVRTAVDRVYSRWAFLPGTIDDVPFEMTATLRLPPR